MSVAMLLGVNGDYWEPISSMVVISLHTAMV